MILPLVVTSLLAATPAARAETCSEWSLAGYYSGMDASALTDPLEYFFTGKPEEVRIEQMEFQELTICIDVTSHVRWATAIVARGEKWQEAWKARFHAQYLFPIGCEDHVDGSVNDPCRFLLWSDNGCSAVLTEIDDKGPDKKAIVTVRLGLPTFITITKTDDGGVEYRNTSPEKVRGFVALSCE